MGMWQKSKAIKRVSLILAGALLIGSLAGCGKAKSGEENKSTGSESGNVVKIGVLLPLSGPVAPNGLNSKNGHDLALEEINSKGGIKALNGAKLELVYADSRGDAKIGLSEAERLINKEKVVAILGAYQSSVTYPSTEVAERYQVPYLVPVSIKDDITERGFKYTFRIAPKASQFAKSQIDFIIDQGKETGKVAQKIAMIYEDTDFGQSAAAAWEAYAKEKGLEVVLKEAYPGSSSDLSPVILKLKNAKPDAVLFASYASDAILLTNGLAEMKVNVMGLIGSGAGHADATYLKNTGKNSEYHYDLAEWSADINNPLIPDIAKRAKDKYGSDMNAEFAETYASVFVIADAIERAKSKDPKAIREELAKTRIESGPASILPAGKIEFDEKGQNKYAQLIMVQVRDGKRVTVWPQVAAAQAPVWPAPKYEDRK